jgi:structure-specific recognition protein 1
LHAIAQDLIFYTGGKPAFSLPLQNVHNTSINKTEVALEFLNPIKPTDAKKKKRGDPGW